MKGERLQKLTYIVCLKMYKYIDIVTQDSKFKNRSAFVKSKCVLVFKFESQIFGVVYSISFNHAIGN